MIRILIFCCLCFGLSSRIFGQYAEAEEERGIDWSDPETIDPLNEDIGSFLDVDLSDYRKKAFDSYQLGDYEEAARYYLFLLRHNVQDASSIYNLACCYGLLGKAGLAAKYLDRAVKAGFEDIEHIKQDPDFEKVRGSKVFDAEVDSVSLQIEKKRKGMGDIIYIDASALFKCRIHLPSHYDPEKMYPLVVGLHGRHSSADQFTTLWRGFGDPQFVYASLQAPYPVAVGKEVGYDWTRHGWTEYDWRSWQTGEKEWMDQDIETTVEHIVELVQDLDNRYSIDEVYLMGFSQGAIFSYITGIYRHKLFKGLICFSGALETGWFPEGYLEAANNLRVFMAHGKDDQSIPYEAGIQARHILTSYGYEVTFWDFAGGHVVPEEALKQVVQWIKKQ